MSRRTVMRLPRRSIPRRSDDRRKHLAIEPLEDRRILALAPNFLDGQIVGRVEFDDLDEASGLVASRQNDGVLWAHNDSGDVARVFAMSVTGKHLGVYDLSGAAALDWEDIAIGPGPSAGVDYLYVADMGDNVSGRSSIQIYRATEPSVDRDQMPVDVDLADVETFTLTYPEGPRDAETLLVDPLSGDLFIVTKQQLTDASQVSEARLYRAAAPLHDGTLELLGELDLTQPVGGDVSASGTEILVKTYTEVFYFSRDEGMSIADALVDVEPATVPYTVDPKGEAITFDPATGGYFTLGERADQPLYFYERVVDTTPPVAVVSAPQDNGRDDADGRKGSYSSGRPTRWRFGSTTRHSTTRALRRRLCL